MRDSRVRQAACVLSGILSITSREWFQADPAVIQPFSLRNDVNCTHVILLEHVISKALLRPSALPAKSAAATDAMEVVLHVRLGKVSACVSCLCLFPGR